MAAFMTAAAAALVLTVSMLSVTARVIFTVMRAHHIGIKVELSVNQSLYGFVGGTGDPTVKLYSGFGKSSLRSAADSAAY